jgi:uncharacterized membrane protein
VQKNDVNTALAIFFIATAVVVIGGLIAIPVIEKHSPSNFIGGQG